MVKEELRRKIEERLNLTVSYGFSEEGAEDLMRKFDEQTKEEDFKDFARTNYICNHVLDFIGARGTNSFLFEKMGPAEIRYYESLSKNRRNLNGKEFAEFSQFVGLKKDILWELGQVALQANEAAEPVWVYHTKQERVSSSMNPSCFKDLNFNCFDFNCQLASKYRNLLCEGPVKNEMLEFRYGGVNREGIRKLMTDAFQRIVNFSEEFLNESSSATDYKITAIAHKHFGNLDAATECFRTAFYLAQGDLNLQERVLADMREAGIKIPFFSGLKVRARIINRYC